MLLEVSGFRGLGLNLLENLKTYLFKILFKQSAKGSTTIGSGTSLLGATSAVTVQCMH